MAFPDGWQRKCAIVIQAAQVAETLTDFPMLVTGDNLPTEIWANADDGGGDLRFSADDAGAVRLACEIVSFDASGESAEIYVKVPSVSSAVNTTIYVWYDNTGQTQPAVTDTYGSQAVWGSDYAAVYHFNQNPAGGTLLDSTANGNNGTAQGGMDAADLVDGQIGAASAWDFDGVNDFVDAGATPKIPATGNFTILAVYFQDVGTNEREIFGQYLRTPGNGRFLIRTTNISVPTIFLGNISPLPTIGLFDTSAKTGWVDFTVSRNSNTFNLRTNGVQRSAYSDATNRNLLQTGNIIAAQSGITVYNADLINFFDGKIDELRVLHHATSENYTVSQYNNLFSSETFAIAGTPTAVSAFNPAWAKHSNQIIRAI